MTQSKDNKVTYKDVWTKLRGIDTSKIITKKGSMDYINWADAWVCIMGHYPDAAYKFPEPVFYKGYDKDLGEVETCEVHCVVNIHGLTREMHLAVMQTALPMKSIPNPTSREISDAKARCLVKTLAMFGFGLYLWEKGNKTTNFKSKKQKVKAFEGKPF